MDISLLKRILDILGVKSISGFFLSLKLMSFLSCGFNGDKKRLLS